MTVNWLDLAVRLVPLAIEILRQIDRLLGQMEDERRPEIDLRPVNDQLPELARLVHDLDTKLNGTHK